MSLFFTRQSGKENLLKEQIAYWCSRAKLGHKILIATPLGNYILEFKGKWKPSPAKIKIIEEDFNQV